MKCCLFRDQGCKHRYIFISRSYIRSETGPDLQGNSLVRQNKKKIKEGKTKWKSKIKNSTKQLIIIILITNRSYNSFITHLDLHSQMDSPKKILLIKVPQFNHGLHCNCKKSIIAIKLELKCKQPSIWSGKVHTLTCMLPPTQFDLTLSVFPHKWSKQLKSDMPGKYRVRWSLDHEDLWQISKTM